MGYGTIKNCHTACVEILKNYGLTEFGSPNHVFKLMYETGDPSELKFYGDNPIENHYKAVQCIDRHLEAGRPIIVGVHHTLDYRPKNNQPINEGTTDHFIVINGRGISNGLNYYTYYEVGTSLINEHGCNNVTNRLIYNPGVPTFSGSQYFTGEEKSYTVTQVRPNDGDTNGTISQFAK